MAEMKSFVNLKVILILIILWMVSSKMILFWLKPSKENWFLRHPAMLRTTFQGTNIVIDNLVITIIAITVKWLINFLTIQQCSLQLYKVQIQSNSVITIIAITVTRQKRWTVYTRVYTDPLTIKSKMVDPCKWRPPNLFVCFSFILFLKLL